MCRLLKVSPSGYYAWLQWSESPRDRKDRILLVKIKAVFKASRSRYGSPRIQRALREDRIRCGRRRIARLMRQNGLRAKHRRKYRATTNSKHSHPVAPNLLERRFKVSKPNEVWVSDITYIWTGEGWLYLATVMDLYARRIVGWAVRSRLTKELAMAALSQAIALRNPKPGLIHHSDRGSQYASNAYRKLLKTRGIRCSMSRKGDCWDNAVAESFFRTLKVECVYGSSLATREITKRILFDYIEVFYNRERLHSTLGYVSPVNFERMEQVA